MMVLGEDRKVIRLSQREESSQGVAAQLRDCHLYIQVPHVVLAGSGLLGEVALHDQSAAEENKGM